MYLIELPTPPRECSPNFRGHWSEAYRAKKTLRSLAYYEALRMLAGRNAPRWDHATYTVEWRHRTKKRPDEDNAQAMLKAALDGIQDAGIVSNDRGLRRVGSIRFVQSDNPGVTITVSRDEEPKP